MNIQNLDIKKEIKYLFQNPQTSFYIPKSSISQLSTSKVLKNVNEKRLQNGLRHSKCEGKCLKNPMNAHYQ